MKSVVVNKSNTYKAVEYIGVLICALVFIIVLDLIFKQLQIVYCCYPDCAVGMVLFFSARYSLSMRIFAVFIIGILESIITDFILGLNSLIYVVFVYFVAKSTNYNDVYKQSDIIVKFTINAGVIMAFFAIKWFGANIINFGAYNISFHLCKIAVTSIVAVYLAGFAPWLGAQTRPSTASSRL